MKYQTLPWIAGNPLTLRIPLQKVTITADGHETEDYEPQDGDVVTIILRSQRSEKSYVPEIEGNIATIADNGTLLIGEYAVETMVVESDGTKRRSYYPFVLNVMKATPDMLAYFDDYTEYGDGVLLDTPSIFFAVGGGTIDAYTKAESDARFVNKVELTAYSTTQQMLAAIASALNGYATQQYVDGKVRDEATRATGAEQALRDAIGLKQDIINDLASIREGAALGATAVQPSALSGYESKVAIVSASGATLNAQVGKYYTLSNVGTLAITLPTIAAGTTKVQTVSFYIEAGSSPDVDFISTHTVIKSDGFAIEANKVYGISAAWNGIGWVIGQMVLDYTPPIINIQTKSTGNQNAAITVTKGDSVNDISYTSVQSGSYWDNGIIKVMYSPTGYTGWVIFAETTVNYNGVEYSDGDVVNNWAYNSNVDFDIYY